MFQPHWGSGLDVFISHGQREVGVVDHLAQFGAEILCKKPLKKKKKDHTIWGDVVTSFWNDKLDEGIGV